MGICRICGNNRELTREHVPPKGARNSGRICAHSLYALSKGLARGEIFQNGLTRRTLCSECNGKTARHYGQAFASWTLRALEYHKQMSHSGNIALPLSISALRVAKQLAVMTLAMSEPASLDLPHFFHLRQLVMRPHQYGYVPKFRFFTYFHIGPPVFEGCFYALHTHGGPSPMIFCQVGREPLGYIVTSSDDSSIVWARHLNLCEISHFFKSPLDIVRTEYLALPRLHGSIPFRCISRT